MTTGLWVIGAVVAAIVAFRLLGRVFEVVAATLRQVLGGLYDYAAIYFVLLSTVVAALVVLFFAVSLPVWFGLVVLVLLLVVVLFELLL
jgi:hypothetical protein